MKNNTIETLVGTLVVIVAVIFLLLSSKIVNSSHKVANSYEVYAEFNNIEGINIGSDVKIAGVKVGTVDNIKLDSNYKAILTIKIQEDKKVSVDSVFKISTSGIIGNKFINIKPGSDDELLANKDTVEYTESVMDLEDLISRYIFNSNSNVKK